MSAESVCSYSGLGMLQNVINRLPSGSLKWGTMTGQGARDVPSQDVNHAAFDHAQLKQWTDDADTGTTQAFADEWARTGAVLAEAADALKRAALGSEAGWVGEAAEAMRARLGQIAGWSSETGSQIVAASQSITRESEAADTARRAMPDPVSFQPADIIRDAPGNGLLALAALPGLMVQRYEQSRAAHEEAVRVVSERDGAMSSAAGEVAVFRAPPSLDGSADGAGESAGAGRSGGPGGHGGPGGSGGVDGFGGPGGPGGPGGVGGPGGAGGPGGVGGPGGSGGAGEPGGSGGAGFSGDGVVGVLGDEPAGVTAAESFVARETVGPPNGAGSVANPGSGPGGPSIGGSGIGGPGSGGGGLLGGGALGNGVLGGGALGGGAPGSGAPGGGGSAGGRGLPPVIPAPADGRGAGRGVPIGGVPAGVGRVEDVEHPRPEYLQEPDPDGLFESDVVTAPAVIGGSDVR
jgi:hypothetical protein